MGPGPASPGADDQPAGEAGTAAEPASQPPRQRGWWRVPGTENDAALAAALAEYESHDDEGDGLSDVVGAATLGMGGPNGTSRPAVACGGGSRSWGRGRGLGGGTRGVPGSPAGESPRAASPAPAPMAEVRWRAVWVCPRPEQGCSSAYFKAPITLRLSTLSWLGSTAGLSLSDGSSSPGTGRAQGLGQRRGPAEPAQQAGRGRRCGGAARRRAAGAAWRGGGGDGRRPSCRGV